MGDTRQDWDIFVRPKLNIWKSVFKEENVDSFFLFFLRPADFSGLLFIGPKLAKWSSVKFEPFIYSLETHHMVFLLVLPLVLMLFVR
jgi:hypothetical protein